MDPLHITEFASERYFSKLKELNKDAENAATSAGPDIANNVPLPPLLQGNSFILPLGKQRPTDNEAIPFRPSDQKKRSLGHDLSSLRTQRRPTFTGSLGSLRSKVAVVNKTPTIGQHYEHILAEEGGVSEVYESPPMRTSTYPNYVHRLTLGDLFLALPNELQEHIIAPLPIHDILNLRLVSKSFHTLVALNESPIARYHVAHSLPQYSLQLYPAPNPTEITLHYLCSMWHRLHVVSKLSVMVARQVVKEIFLRATAEKYREFEPQHRRLIQRLMPIIFTIFHFFETYRDLHVQHLAANGTPLNRQAFTVNPIEAQVMAMYDDRTLLKAHQAWALIISSFSRRLRPPSYVGTVERSIKGYLKGRPPDEVYTTILAVGGLRQAQRFWETKGYNVRRASVDTWYSLITRNPVEAAPKSKLSIITSFGRRKKEVAPPAEASNSGVAHHDTMSCNEWFCVKPSCQAARRRHSTDNLVFHSSLAAGPPMSPLPRDKLQRLLPDLQHLSNIWVHTAEALILERKILERPQQMQKISQVLLELIRDDGTEGLDEWSSANPRAVQTAPAEVSGNITD